jgi:hypothetical protein
MGGIDRTYGTPVKPSASGKYAEWGKGEDSPDWEILLTEYTGLGDTSYLGSSGLGGADPRFPIHSVQVNPNRFPGKVLDSVSITLTVRWPGGVFPHILWIYPFVLVEGVRVDTDNRLEISSQGLGDPPDVVTATATNVPQSPNSGLELGFNRHDGDGQQGFQSFIYTLSGSVTTSRKKSRLSGWPIRD